MGEIWQFQQFGLTLAYMWQLKQNIRLLEWQFRQVFMLFSIFLPSGATWTLLPSRTEE